MADGTDRREKMDDETVEAAVLEALTNSLGSPGSDVDHARQRNIEFYNAEALGELAPPEVEDRSDFVATDVGDTVDGMLPQIMRMFVGSDEAVMFEGQGQEGSEQQAKLATAYVNHQFYVKNDGVGIIHDWFKDALLQKVGFAKVWAEEQATDAKQKYEGQSPEQLMMLMQEGWELAEEPEQEESGAITFTVKKESKQKVIRIQACAPSEMRVDVNARWGAEPAMIAQVFARRRFELEQDGYDLSDVGSAGRAEGSALLGELGETDDLHQSAPHESHEELAFAECYIKLDRDGDGIAEWLKVCIIGNQIAVYAENGELAIEQVDDHPFVWICPIPRSHAFFGDCPADRAIQPQKLRTRTIRSIEDNMLLSVNQRMYVNTSANVNIDDVLDSRAGGIIRGQGDASTAIQPIVQPNLGAPAYQFNEYIGSWAENRTGFNRYSAGTDQNALNKTKGGMEMLTAKADMRTELIARFFGVGVKHLMAKVLKLSIQHQNVAEMIKINGQFVPINPSEFRNQFNVKINVGLGSGSKEQQMARIMAVGQLMLGPGIQAGVVMPQHVSELIRLAVEANEFKNPEKFVSPEPVGMPPNPQAYNEEKQQIQQQMQQMQEQMQQLGQENEGLKAEKASKEGDLALKGAELQLKDRELTLKEHETAASLQIQSQAAEQSQRDSQIKNAQTAQQMDRADSDDAEVADLKEQVATLTQVVQQIVQALTPQESMQ